jgi:hypothetical protein
MKKITRNYALNSAFSKMVNYNTGGSKLVNLERSKIEKLSFENTKKWVL